MPKEFTELGFEIEFTADGSPTLRLQNQGESMHHSGGAAAETRYIYGDVLESAHQVLRDSCKTCVVGLGLGYIEISWALSLIKTNLSPSAQISFHSFEVVPGLIKNFYAWMHSDDEHAVYDLIVKKLDSSASLLQVKSILRQALEAGSTLQGDFADLNQHQEKYNVICYDAFSKKTSESLWGADFLNLFFNDFSRPNCVVTTYACTGIFRKTLLEKGFAFFKRPGFCGKRDSTLATRGRLEIKHFPSKIFQTSSYNQ